MSTFDEHLESEGVDAGGSMLRPSRVFIVGGVFLRRLLRRNLFRDRYFEVGGIFLRKLFSETERDFLCRRGLFRFDLLT